MNKWCVVFRFIILLLFVILMNGIVILCIVIIGGDVFEIIYVFGVGDFIVGWDSISLIFDVLKVLFDVGYMCLFNVEGIFVLKFILILSSECVELLRVLK